MNKLLSLISDGDGNVSHTRAINVLVALSWLGSKFYNAYLTKQPIAWGGDDMAMLGVIGGVSVAKTISEKPTTEPTKP